MSSTTRSAAIVPVVQFPSCVPSLSVNRRNIRSSSLAAAIIGRDDSVRLPTLKSAVHRQFVLNLLLDVFFYFFRNSIPADIYSKLLYYYYYTLETL